MFLKLMIPARTSCPSSWTREYKGYLMTEQHNHASNKVYKCVDENPESIDGSGVVLPCSSLHYQPVLAGLPCPP